MGDDDDEEEEEKVKEVKTHIVLKNPRTGTLGPRKLNAKTDEVLPKSIAKKKSGRKTRTQMCRPDCSLSQANSSNKSNSKWRLSDNSIALK